MHVPVYLGFGVERAKIEHVLIVRFEYESVIGGEQVMIENNQGLIFLHGREVIFQPVIYILQSVIGRVVAVVDGGDYIMDISDIK